ncbi:hypothetical protein B0A50_05209 [Salinomyces thailandicus]|uniref:Uncharacterized protein n=1 Tax=Salinomyces thailandicus TaxID=706561 RepID=A0A4U0TX89_9PEZI|nr:hypothetical protein B0A50_05209 [Salinomyces thailandica]
MTLPQFALDYEKCEVSELQACIRQRCEPAAAVSKSYYINLLKYLDKRSTFQFMELPAEMRNRVYRELLVWPSDEGCGGGRCWPQILAVSKQINHEARDIIYEENSAPINVSITIDYNEDRRTTTTIDCGGKKPAFSTQSGLPEWQLDCPAHIMTFASISIDVRVNVRWHASVTQPQEDIHLPITEALYAVSSSLTGHKKLERLHLRIQNSGPGMTPLCITDVLWPLSKLSLPAACLHVTIKQKTGEAHKFQVKELNALSSGYREDLLSQYRAVLAAHDDVATLIAQLDDAEAESIWMTGHDVWDQFQTDFDTPDRQLEDSLKERIALLREWLFSNAHPQLQGILRLKHKLINKQWGVIALLDEWVFSAALPQLQDILNSKRTLIDKQQEVLQASKDKFA